MIANIDLLEIFDKYVKPNGLPWEEAGLIDDAPIEAVEAYEKWVELKKEYRAMEYM